MSITLWRIERKKYKDNFLKGEGARLFGGRWNSKGNPMVYTSENLALAAWEKRVHFERTPAGMVPMSAVDLIAVKLSAPDSLEVIDIDTLDKDWWKKEEITRDIGDQWIKNGNSLLLKIPTVLMQRGVNYLVNPAHPKIDQVKIIETLDFDFDIRSFR